MSWSKKYGRTYHYPFSPGTTSDDRIHHDWWTDMQQIDNLVHTEKLDGENTCLNQYGVFARSHAAPTIHPWANYLKERWSWMRRDLGELEIFGENLYAIHSIEYLNLEQHFYVFAVREGEQWLSWEEVEFYAAMLDFPTVPVLKIEKPSSAKLVEETVLDLAKQNSQFDSVDAYENTTCSTEGVVSRNSNAYAVDDFKKNVFKYVRKDHVKTDEHWTRNWRRAKLVGEKSS